MQLAIQFRQTSGSVQFWSAVFAVKVGQLCQPSITWG